MVPKDELTDPAKDWVKLQGSNATRVSQILDTKDEKVLQGIQNGIDRANKRAPSNAQRIQKWSILPVDFSIPGGELGKMLSPYLYDIIIYSYDYYVFTFRNCVLMLFFLL